MKTMLTTYRQMLPEDEDAIFGLRMVTWGAPDINYVRQHAYTDPLYLQHTFGAFAPDGTLLSTVSYRIREIRDAEGAPRAVGCVASVTTIESARRQGHAANLMRLALDSMTREECDWSLLFSSAMGVPLYEALGYRRYDAPYYQGVLAEETATVELDKASCSIAVLEEPFDIMDPDWQAIRSIYASYNARRPLSLVRDEDYWRYYFAPRLATSPTGDVTKVFVASAEDRPVAYLIVRLLANAAAQDFFHEDQGFAIREVAALPEHEEAFPLLTAALRRVLSEWRPPAKHTRPLPGAAYIPRETPEESCARNLFGSTMHLSGERRRTMAIPLARSVTEADLAATFQAHSAHFGQMDIF